MLTKHTIVRVLCLAFTLSALLAPLTASSVAAHAFIAVSTLPPHFAAGFAAQNVGRTAATKVESHEPTSLPRRGTEGEDTFTVDVLNRLTSSLRKEPGQADFAESFAYNAMGALSTYGAVQLPDQRNRRDGGGQVASAVPTATSDGAVTIDTAGRLTQIGDLTLTYGMQSEVRSIARAQQAGTSTLNIEYDADLKPYRRNRTGMDVLRAVGGGPIVSV